MLYAMPAVERAPEWAGWAALSALVAAFALLLWWLFFSRGAGPIRTGRDSNQARGDRRRLALLMLLSGTLAMIGARWDELWHRVYGGFGEDFLWPPHLLLYAALGLNAVFAGIGLATALRGRGGLRERVRAEPLMGLLGLLALYQIASIPSDLLWHEIIGPDITAWSLPHLLLVLTIGAVYLTGLPIALSTSGSRPWRGLRGLMSIEVVALGLVSVFVLNMLHIGTTEWEWIADLHAGSPVLRRPSWTYPVVALAVGIGGAHLALFATRRFGAASLVALVVLLVQALTLLAYRAEVSRGPVLAAHALILLPSLALDAWYAARQSRIGVPSTLVGGVLVYCLVFFAVAFPYLRAFMPMLPADGSSRLEAVLVGVPVALVAGLLWARIGGWLGRLAGGGPYERPIEARSAEA